jgi:hypothetical protein
LKLAQASEIAERDLALSSIEVDSAGGERLTKDFPKYREEDLLDRNCPVVPGTSGPTAPGSKPAIGTCTAKAPCSFEPGLSMAPDAPSRVSRG